MRDRARRVPRRRLLGPWLLLALATSAIAIASANSAGPDDPPAADPGSRAAADGRVEAFRTALDAEGLQALGGGMQRVDALALVDRHVLNSASGNNAGQPYKRLTVPGENAGVFRLNPYEALVYVGRTPPPADYFSFTPYLFVRHYQTAPNRDWLFAAVGDPLNSKRIKTEGSGDPFMAETMVIFTADRRIYERVAAAARSAGYPASMLNRYTLPSNVLRLGTSAASDSFLILVRTANFKSQAAGERYLDDNDWADVFRVTPRAVPDLDPLPQQAWRKREWRPEDDLTPGIRGALKRLRRAIISKTAHSTAQRFGSVRWFYDSKDVLPDDPGRPAYRQFVAGEGSDTPYLRTAKNGDPVHFRLGRDDRLVVYGVNHAATGLATYSNFGVYGEWRLNACERPHTPRYIFGCGEFIWNGVASMTNHHFRGSARRYLPRDPLARYLYAVTVVRRKNQCPAGRHDRYCLKVPQPSRPRKDPPSADGIGLRDPLMIGYRAYLNPHTRSGPAYSDIIPDRSILFRR